MASQSTTIKTESKTKGVAHDTGDAITQNILRRLRNIEGQARGLQRMVEEDQYCIDILTQISAIRSALNSVGMKVIRRHIDTCISATIKDNGASKNEMIDELMAVLSRQQL